MSANTTIYYFSATGNSLAVAKDLAKELGGAEIAPIPKAIRSGEYPPSDTVGIVFPVYMFGLPLIIARFLKTVKIKEGAYVFAVATFGALAGRPFMLAGKILAGRGIKLAAGFNVLMPGNYTPFYGAIPDAKQKAMFGAEEKRIKYIADTVRGRRAGIFEEKFVSVGALFCALFYKLGASQVPTADRDFWAADSCNGCGLCEKVCPVDNIAMKGGKPVWQHHCEHCMACLQWCPAEAIQYKKITIGRRRYRHPAAQPSDISAGA